MDEPVYLNEEAGKENEQTLILVQRGSCCQTKEYLEKFEGCHRHIHSTSTFSVVISRRSQG